MFGKKKPPTTKRSPISGIASRQKFVNDRSKRISSTNRTSSFKVVTAGFVVFILFASLFGVFGIVAYSLKNNGQLPIFQQISGYIKTTPLSFLVSGKEEEKVAQFVVALPELPIYPGSEFIFSTYVDFENNGTFRLKTDKTGTETDALFRFLSSGQSVYRMPAGTEWSAIREFYKRELEANGWVHELSVEITDFERVPGDYFTKDTVGVHLYDVSYDIWYEKITVEQAKQGLHDKVIAYKAKQELVEAASGKELSSEYKWQLKYSRDWTLEPQKHATLDVTNLFFFHDKTHERVSIAAVRKYAGNIADLDYAYLEGMGNEHISAWLTTQPIAVTLKGFAKKQLTIAGGKAFEFADVKNGAYFLFLGNRKNGMVYVISYVGKESGDFYQYIKENLKN